MSGADDRVLNAFTVDVEEYFQVHAFDGVVERDRWDEYESRVEPATIAILDLLDEHDVKGTFFVLGWIAERHAGLLCDIRDRGHEIASHGYEHRFVTSFDPAGFAADLRRAEKAIEDACGAKMEGFRAPTFSIRGDTGWAFDVLRDLGYRWSSSVFPVKHDNYGIPTFPRHPVPLVDAKGRILWEFPLTTHRVLGRNLPVAGGGWLRAVPPMLVHKAWRTVNAKGWPAITYVHPWEVDPDQPRIENAPRKSRFRHYLNLDKMLGRLRGLLERFPFGTVSQALEAYRSKQEAARP